jgi:hypothetical protein
MRLTLQASTMRKVLPLAGSTLPCRPLALNKLVRSEPGGVRTTSPSSSPRISHVRFAPPRSLSAIARFRLSVMLGFVNATSSPSAGRR